MAVTHILSRDGQEIMRGTSFECTEYIHKNHSFSLDHAIRYEGYTMTENNMAAPFTQNDWDEFSGAESWDNGDQPVIRYYNETAIIADKSSIQAININAKGDYEIHQYPNPLPTQKAALALLDAIPSGDWETLKAYGFIKI